MKQKPDPTRTEFVMVRADVLADVMKLASDLHGQFERGTVKATTPKLSLMRARAKRIVERSRFSVEVFDDEGQMVPKH